MPPKARPAPIAAAEAMNERRVSVFILRAPQKHSLRKECEGLNTRDDLMRQEVAEPRQPEAWRALSSHGSRLDSDFRGVSCLDHSSLINAARSLIRSLFHRRVPRVRWNLRTPPYAVQDYEGSRQPPNFQSKPSRKIVSLTCVSKAPISAPAPNTRTNPGPRWSVSRFATLLPASIAGLPEDNACVNVGPPLSARESSRGSAWIVSGGSSTAEVPMRLCAPMITPALIAPTS